MRPRTRLISALCGAAVILVSAVAGAQARPDTRAMDCANAQALVQQNGAVVLSTGTHTYDRFVRSQSFCTYSEVAQMTWVPTTDDRQCPVGYTCKQDNFDDVWSH